MHNDGDLLKLEGIKGKIETLILEGHITEAERLLTLLSEKASNDQRINSMWASLYIMKKDYNRAKKILIDSLKIYPLNQDLLFNLAFVYEQEGFLQEAYSLYNGVSIIGDEFATEDANSAMQKIKNIIVVDEKQGIFQEWLLDFPNNLKNLKTLEKVLEKITKYMQVNKRELEVENKQSTFLEAKKSIRDKIDLIKDIKGGQNSRGIKKVLFIQDIQCTRTNKIASALQKKGIQVDAIYLKLHPSQVYKGIILPYTKIYKLDNVNAAINFINNSDYDILYSSNEPDYLTVLFTATNKPIVHDTHDLMSLRGDITIEQQVLEYIANVKSSGNLYVTDSVKEIAYKKFNLVNKPIMTLNNYIDKDFLPEKFYEKLSGIDSEIHCVFEGGLSGVEGHHRFLEPLFMKLIENNIHVHLFGHVDPNYIKVLEEKSEFIHYEGILPPHQLIQEMTKFDVGLLFFNVNERNKDFLDTTFANKVWDYLAAGLPIAFVDLKIYQNFLCEHKVGHVIDFSESIIDQIMDVKNININKNYLVDNKLLMDEKADQIIEFLEKIKRSNKMETKEKNSIFYDNLYNDGGYNKAYHKHYSETLYYNSWKQALELLFTLDNPKLLEIGCGVGQFAHMLFDNGFSDYLGIDFSENAIKLAKERNIKHSDKFLVEDVYSTNIFDNSKYTVMIIFEVLEHIEEDISILEKINPGSKVFFSVPNFDSESHVRYFEDENAVVNRYSEVIIFENLFSFNIGPKNKIFLVEGTKK